MKQRSSPVSSRRSNPPTRDNHAIRSGKGVKFETSVTIHRTPDELYAFWRNFENLPRVMKHVESVECLDERRSHWRARISEDKMVEWDAEVINEHPNELIAWQSLPGSDVRQAGTVRFTPAADGLGTEVKLAIEYEVPGGFFTRVVAKISRTPEEQIQEDLRHFKELMEGGEIPSSRL